VVLIITTLIHPARSIYRRTNHETNMTRRNVWILGAAIWSIAAHVWAQPDPRNSIGFDEFRLCMRVNEVQNILRGQRWQSDPENYNPISPGFSGSIFVKARTSLSDEERHSIMVVGCSETAPTECAEIMPVRLIFMQGILQQIYVAQAMRDTGLSPLAWCSLAVRAVERDNGRADFVSPLYVNNATPESETISDLNNGTHRVANWRRFKYQEAVDQSIQVAFLKYSSGSTVRAWLSIEDNTFYLWPEVIEEERLREEHRKALEEDPTVIKSDKLTPGKKPFD
jgi:hypothetical protein